jgi:hypothetical protein
MGSFSNYARPYLSDASMFVRIGRLNISLSATTTSMDYGFHLHMRRAMSFSSAPTALA